MKIALIALQIIIGLIFLFTGSVKLATPKEKLPAKGVTGFENISTALIKWLALTEVIGAITLLIFTVPTLPKLPTILAVSGFALLMIAASYHHFKRKEYKTIILTFILFLICLIILFLR